MELSIGATGSYPISYFAIFSLTSLDVVSLTGKKAALGTTIITIL